MRVALRPSILALQAGAPAPALALLAVQRSRPTPVRAVPWPRWERVALPAAVVRTAPKMPMRLTLRASAAKNEEVLAEYVFDHQGAIERSSSSNVRE